MIVLSEISKHYDSEVSLNNLNLSIQENKTTVLIGASGSGKSTILRLIMGLITPEKGSIEFDGRLTDKQNLSWVRSQIGYTIQDGGLFPHLTAAENITLVAKELKKTESEIDNKLRQLCTLTNFDFDKLASFPNELSGGQIQRVALMRALMLAPKVLLLDEPMGALDPITRTSLQSDLKKIFQKLQKTVLLVTHDIREASYLGDVLVLLHKGQILQQGSFDDLINKPATSYVTNFITSQRSLI